MDGRRPPVSNIQKNKSPLHVRPPRPAEWHSHPHKRTGPIGTPSASVVARDFYKHFPGYPSHPGSRRRDNMRRNVSRGMKLSLPSSHLMASSSPIVLNVQRSHQRFFRRRSKAAMVSGLTWCSMPSASSSRGSSGNAERLQKGHHGFMPLLAFRSQLAAGVGQENGAVRPGVHVTGLLQPGQRSIDGHVRDAQPPRQVRHARLADGWPTNRRWPRRNPARFPWPDRGANGGSSRPAAPTAAVGSGGAAADFGMERGMIVQSETQAAL